MKCFFFLPFVTFLVLAACDKGGANGSGGTGTDPDPDPATPTNIDCQVTTIAGKFQESGVTDGKGTDARFETPGKLCYDPRNSCLYIVDHVTIRKIDAANNVSTVLDRSVLNPFDDIRDIDVAPGAAGSLYFTTKNNGLYKLSPAGSSYTLLEITKGSGNNDGALNNNDHLDGAHGVANGLNGDVAVYNTYWTALKRVHVSSLSPVSGTVSAWAGKPTTDVLGAAWPFKDGQGTEATFGNHTWDICSDGIGNIYLADKSNARIRKVTPAGSVGSFKLYMPTDLGSLQSHLEADGVALVTANQDGKLIYFASNLGNTGNSTSLLRVLIPGIGVYSVTGFKDGHRDGDGEIAAFGAFGGIACTPDGKTIYISESSNSVIRKVILD